mgnify:CR=1 FL=1
MNHSSCFGLFARYCSLNVLGMLALSCYILSDTFFVANTLGSDGLAALNLAIPIYSFIHGLGLVLGMGGATRFTILKHQGREEEASAAFTHVLALAGAAAFFFFSCGLFFSRSLAILLGAEGDVLPMTQTYIHVLLLFAPAILLNDLLLCFVRNDGAPQRSMAAMVTGSLSNIVLDYLFMVPLNMGIFGAVFATGLAPVISLAVLSPFFLGHHNTFRPVRCAPSPHLLGLCAAAGVPSLLAELSSGVVMVVFNAVLLSLEGSTGVAAYGVVANLSLVVLAIYNGVAQGVQPLLSGYYGSGDRSRIRSILRYASATVLMLSALICLGTSLGAGPISALFNQEGDPLLQDMAVQGMRLYFIACPWAGMNLLTTIFFASTDHPRPAQLISLLRGYFLILPLALLLPRLWGLTGLWLAFPIAEALTAAAALALFLRVRRQL